MAHLIRNTKSGPDWILNDLAAYNTIVGRQDTATFFGQVAPPPSPTHHPGLLNGLTVKEWQTRKATRLSGLWILR